MLPTSTASGDRTAPAPRTVHFRLLLASIIAGLTAFAWSNRFVQDDAFISFRYADHLARGKGLVWNIGDRIEGFTNFLWTLAIAAALRLQLDAVTTSYILGLACFAGTLYLTYALTRELTDRPWMGLLAVALTGLNYSFSCYATGGLETQSQALFFVASAYLLARLVRTKEASVRSLALLSTVLAGAIWTRLDSGILVALVGLYASYHVLSRRIPAGEKRAQLLALVLPFSVLVGALLLFKQLYFGHVLPNTFYAKSSSGTSLDRGIGYVRSFARVYDLTVVGFLLVLTLVPLVRARNGVLLVIASVVLGWLGYVVKVGGDFMEFRFFVPVLPLAFCWLAWVFASYVPQWWLRTAIVAPILIASSDHAHATSRQGFLQDGLQIETITGLHDHIRAPHQDWPEVGRGLGEAFNHDPRVSIAVMAAGAIPYYSKLTTIDLLGLNDAWIARHGEVIGSRPGHQRVAPLSYLVERGVNLVVHPWGPDHWEQKIERYTLADAARYVHVSDPREMPATARVIEVPLNPSRTLRVLYLTPSPLIDDAIRTGQWRVFEIER